MKKVLSILAVLLLTIGMISLNNNNSISAQGKDVTIGYNPRKTTIDSTTEYDTELLSVELSGSKLTAYCLNARLTTPKNVPGKKVIDEANEQSISSYIDPEVTVDFEMLKKVLYFGYHGDNTENNPLFEQLKTNYGANIKENREADAYYQATQMAIWHITSANYSLEGQDTLTKMAKDVYDYAKNNTIPEGINVVISVYKPDANMDDYQSNGIQNVLTVDFGEESKPSILNTTAKGNGSTGTIEISKGEEVTLTDVVSLKDLKAGTSYTLRLSLYKDKQLINTQPVTLKGGESEVTVTFDQKLTEAGEYCIMSELILGDKCINTHNGDLLNPNEKIVITIKEEPSEDPEDDPKEDPKEEDPKEDPKEEEKPSTPEKKTTPTVVIPKTGVDARVVKVIYKSINLNKNIVIEK